MAGDRFTDFWVEYNLFDTSALQDLTAASSTNQSFGNLGLFDDNSKFTDYMTLEHNYGLLDDSIQEFPDEVPDNVVYFSSVKSKLDGTFEQNPKVRFNFTRTHSSAALTLYFVGDYPLEAFITWISESGSIIYRNKFEITGNKHVIEHGAENYLAIEIEFTKALPERYIKFYFVEFGISLLWDETNIKSATLVQEIDRLSDKIPVGQLTFEVIDAHNNQFNMANAEGIHRYFQYTQKCIAHENINGKDIILGNFYLSQFSENTNIGKMTWSNILTILDSFTYLNGKLYDGVEAGELIRDIFATAGITEFEIDSETEHQPIYGTLKPDKCRNCLREILFACNSIISTVGGDIKISKTSPIIMGELSKGSKISTNTKKRTYYYGVEIKYDTYALPETAEEKTEVAKGDYDAGTYTIQFDSPCIDLEINTGTIVESGIYYCVFTIEENASIIIKGKQYQATNNSITVYQDSLEAGEAKNIITYNCSVVNSKTAAILGRQILNYLNYKLEFTVKHIADNAEMDTWYYLQNPVSDIDNYLALFTKRNINLTGGFIDTSTLIGKIDDSANFYFADSELIADDEVII